MFVYGFLSLLVTVSFLIGEVKVYGTVDSDRITINGTLSYSVTAEESEGYPQLDILQIKDFAVISGPSQSSSFQWVNGKMSSSKSLSWTLIPNRAGTLSIPPMKVKVDNREYELKPVSISVGQIQSRDQQAKGEDEEQRDREAETPIIFLEVVTDKNTVFQGEQVSVTYKLYTRVNIRQYTMDKKPQGVGFWIEEQYVPKQPSFRETRFNGVRYQVATLYKIALFSTSTGTLIVDPMMLVCTVEVPSRSRFPSLFDDFFSDRLFSRTEQQVVRSEPLTIQVKPLPELGKPFNYTGAVGEYYLTSYLDTTLTEVNQAISYTIELTGTGNIRLFQLEDPIFPEGLEVFNPKISPVEEDPFRDEISGTKRLEYILIPRREGRFLIPSTELTYFNPKSSKWEATSTEVLTVNVQPGRFVFEQTQGLTKEEIALLGQDIRYIRIKPVRLKPLDQRMIPALFWWLSVLSITFFVSPEVAKSVRSNRRKRLSDIDARRAFRKAHKKLKLINDSDDFIKITTVIYEYLSSKFNVPIAGLDARSVRILLDGKVNSEKIDSLIEIISVCDQAQYAPVDLSKLGKDVVGLANRTLTMLDGINKEI